jgi:hypothetical protein
MNDSEARDYRWRWVEAGLVEPTDADQLVLYVLDFLRNHQGVEDPVGYIAALDKSDRQRQARDRRSRRLAWFKGLRA